jgi:GT2 family glycosyltransferase
MATVETRAGAASVPPPQTEPSVLAVLVVRDGAAWLRQCLMGLAKQTHPRLGVLAVDNASTDGSVDLLEAALGPERVLRSAGNVGFSGAVRLALASEAAQQADYVLLMHDDTTLDPEAITALVEAAERVEGVGVVGPKVLDWVEPRVLREIGLSTDRFGYPYSPLEEGEIDQGQYDRIREVLYVSSCAMLVSRETWSRIGPPDERLSPAHDDLDFCWRARLAGFRVLMTPRAVARHRGATGRGERGGSAPSRLRYHTERVALASILKNYGLLSLLWILPLSFLQGLVRVGVFLATRRFQDAYQVLAAWAWNLVHLPGTLRRRVRVQAVRSVPDRSVRRSMAPAWIRLRRFSGSLVSTRWLRRGPCLFSSARSRIAISWGHPVSREAVSAHSPARLLDSSANWCRVCDIRDWEEAVPAVPRWASWGLAASSPSEARPCSKRCCCWDCPRSRRSGAIERCGTIRRTRCPPRLPPRATPCPASSCGGSHKDGSPPWCSSPPCLG